MKIKLGIIGGSGLDDPQLLQDYHEEDIETKYGKPSSTIVCGKINGIDVCILARHGKKHEIPPSQINYRANIAALKMIGCTHIIATSAVGSLKQEIMPGDLVFPDQVIDFTKQRKNTFHDEIGEGKVIHLPFSNPFSQELRDILIKTTQEFGFRKHDKSTLVVIEGPRFSSYAESLFFRNYADIIGMTALPEACLAKEAGLEYATIAMSTDYDCWKKDEEPVTFEMVKKIMKDNAEKVKKIIIESLKKFSFDSQMQAHKEVIKNSIKTVPHWPKPGVMFRDITSLLENANSFKKVIDIFVERYKDKKIDIIAGIESRGFIFGSVLAEKLGVGFVLVRKPGKLPRETIKQEYDLEYGADAIEIHKDSVKPGQRVLVIDDLIATGGTAQATCNLIERLGGQIVECAFVIDLPDLKGKEKISKWPVFSIVEFEGD